MAEAASQLSPPAPPGVELFPVAVPTNNPTEKRKRGRPKKTAQAQEKSEKQPEFALFPQTGPLVRDSVKCRVCLSIMIEPVTFPCHHTACKECFEIFIRDTSLNCLFCRLRLGGWHRKATKNKTLVDQKLWERIQQQFPEEVRARMAGEDSQNESQTSSCDGRIDGRLVESGAVREEYLLLLAQFKAEVERARLEEEEASNKAIRQEQEEEAARVAAQLKADAELAQRIQEEEAKRVQQQHEANRKKLQEELARQTKEKLGLFVKEKTPLIFSYEAHQKAPANASFSKRKIISPIPGPSTGLVQPKRHFPQAKLPVAKPKYRRNWFCPIFKANSVTNGQQKNGQVLASGICIPPSGKDNRGGGTPDSISDEYSQSFRPIVSAPKTPPKPNQNGSHGLMKEPIAKSSKAVRCLPGMSGQGSSGGDFSALEFTVNECNAASPKFSINGKWVRKPNLSPQRENDEESVSVRTSTSSSVCDDHDKSSEKSMIITGQTDKYRYQDGNPISADEIPLDPRLHDTFASEHLPVPVNANDHIRPLQSSTGSADSAISLRKNNDLTENSAFARATNAENDGQAVVNVTKNEEIKMKSPELEVANVDMLDVPPCVNKAVLADELRLQADDEKVIIENEKLGKKSPGAEVPNGNIREVAPVENHEILPEEMKLKGDAELHLPNEEPENKSPEVKDSNINILKNDHIGQKSTDVEVPNGNLPELPPVQDQEMLPDELNLQNEDVGKRPPEVEVPTGNVLETPTVENEQQRRLSEELKLQEEKDLKLARRIQRAWNTRNFVEREYVTRRSRQSIENSAQQPTEAPARASSARTRKVATKTTKPKSSPKSKTTKSKSKGVTKPTAAAASPVLTKMKTPIARKNVPPLQIVTTKTPRNSILSAARKSPRISIDAGTRKSSRNTTGTAARKSPRHFAPGAGSKVQMTPHLKGKSKPRGRPKLRLPKFPLE